MAMHVPEMEGFNLPLWNVESCGIGTILVPKMNCSVKVN